MVSDSEFTTSPMRTMAVEGSVPSFTPPMIMLAMAIDHAGGDVDALAVDHVGSCGNLVRGDGSDGLDFAVDDEETGIFEAALRAGCPDGGGFDEDGWRCQERPSVVLGGGVGEFGAQFLHFLLLVRFVAFV